MSEKVSKTKEAKVFVVEDIVKYHEGSVVSKTLCKNPAGSITVFSFDKGQGLSEHQAPYDAIVHIIDGEVEITVAKKKHQLKKGQMIIMPANVPHALKGIAKFKMMLIMIKGKNE